MRTIFLAALLTASSSTLLSQSTPLDTEYVDCARNEVGTPFASRDLTSPSFPSAQNWGAYGEVTAEHTDDGECRNTTKLFVSPPGGPPQQVFEQKAEQDQGSTLDGNGLQAILWSPSGKRVLFEVSQ